MSTRVVRGNYAVVEGDDLILCDADGGSLTITVPNPGIGSYLRRVQVRKCDRNILTTVTIRWANGTVVQTLRQPHETSRLGCTGLDWTDEVALRNLPPRWPWGA